MYVRVLRRNSKNICLRLNERIVFLLDEIEPPEYGNCLPAYSKARCHISSWVLHEEIIMCETTDLFLGLCRSGWRVRQPTPHFMSNIIMGRKGKSFTCEVLHTVKNKPIFSSGYIFQLAQLTSCTFYKRLLKRPLLQVIY